MLAESYWMTCVTLCQLSDGEEVQGVWVCTGCSCGLLVFWYSEREFLKQLRDKMVEKTQRGVLNYGEPIT